MSKIINEISKIGIIPVIVLDDAKDARLLAKALCNGGLMCAEVTFRTEAAQESIRIMSSEFPEMLVGAGTVLTIDQVKCAVEAGAKFIVSPGFNPEVVKYCLNNHITVIPGTLTPSDIEQAIRFGLTTVKFFPAEAAGGINMIKAIAAPYPNIKFFPSGGINQNNFKDYLDFKRVIACSGSWMVSENIILLGDFDRITTLAKDAINNMLGFEIKSIIINAVDKNIHRDIFFQLKKIFGLNKQWGNCLFVDKKTDSSGLFFDKKGYIVVGTNYIDRAIYYLEKQGIEFDMKTSEYDLDGKLIGISLKRELRGFIVHISQKN